MAVLDLTPLLKREVDLREFTKDLSKDELRDTSNASIDTLLEIIDDVTDAEIVFLPVDEDAHDPSAIEGEETIGWTLGHLVLHVTASAEEGAAVSSMLARGVDVTQRLRFEHDWKTHCQTRQECIDRLEESRRMRNAYLDAWPAEPHLDLIQTFPEDHPFHNLFNAYGSFILGLAHEAGHVEQFREVKRQAKAATENA